jgi:hypothetical protein
VYQHAIARNQLDEQVLGASLYRAHRLTFQSRHEVRWQWVAQRRPTDDDLGYANTGHGALQPTAVVFDLW